MATEYNSAYYANEASDCTFHYNNFLKSHIIKCGEKKIFLNSRTLFRYSVKTCKASEIKAIKSAVSHMLKNKFTKLAKINKALVYDLANRMLTSPINIICASDGEAAGYANRKENKITLASLRPNSKESKRRISISDDYYMESLSNLILHESLHFITYSSIEHDSIDETTPEWKITSDAIYGCTSLVMDADVHKEMKERQAYSYSFGGCNACYSYPKITQLENTKYENIDSHCKDTDLTKRDLKKRGL